MPHQWNEAATLRREQIESGLDLTFSDVFVPWYRDRIADLKPARVVELGAGTGHLAKELHCLTDEYIAFEPSAGMHRVATDVLAATAVRVELATAQQANVTDADLIVAHLCVHVIDELDQVLRAVADMLAPAGRLLAAIPHPCFYNDYKRFFDKGELSYMREQSKEVSFTITADPTREIAGVPYHHRPLSVYVASLVAAHFALVGLHEIVPSEAVMKRYGTPWVTPRYLVLEAMRHYASCKLPSSEPTS